MSTTIDSIQIEIQSNSTNAVANIDGLAKALKKLNKSSDIKDAVASLKSLRNSLHAFVNVPSSASKIESLANSMKSLKKVGKIELGNSLDTIQRAMKSLGAVNIDGVKPKLEAIAAALTPLNNVKGSGFNSAINGLKNLDKVVDDLDAGALDRFVDKIAELDKKLAPVSKRLEAIGHAFKGVNTTSIAAGKGVGTFGTHINATAMNLTNFISVAQSAIAALQPLIHMVSTAINDAIAWDGIEYQFGNAFGEQADIYYQKITEMTDALMINKQTFMETSAMATSMLKGFGVNNDDARKMGLGYTQLAYDVWAAFGNKYKTLQDASDAISSAIAGEVEPIRRAGFTIVESQLEITAANYGVAYSSEKATEAQKSYLRYLTLVDQATNKGIVGAYASEMDTAEGAVRTFTQQLKTLSQTFGSVFLPILVKVMPWLTAFVELIGEAIIAVAGFFGVEIQKVNFSDSFDGITDGAEEATGGVKDATKALKDLKNATIGIDELNVISPQTNSGSGSSGSGGADWESMDVDSLWNKKIWADVQTQVDDIKERIKGMLPVIGGIATAFAGWKISKLVTEVDDVVKKLGKLSPTVKNLAKGLAIAGISIAVGKLTWDFTGAYLESGSLGDLAKMLGTTALGTAVAAWLKGPKGAGIVLTVSGIIKMARLSADLSSGKVDIGDPQAVVTGLLASLETILGGALVIDGLRGGKWTKTIGSAISDGLMKAFGGTSFAWIGSLLKAKLTTALGTVGTALAGVSGWAIAAVAVIVGALIIAFTDYDFTEIGRKIGEMVGKAFRWIVDTGKVVAEWGKSVGQAIKGAIESAIEWVKGELEGKNIWEILWFFSVELPAKALVKLGEIGANIIEGIVEGVVEKWENFCGNLSEFFTGFWEGFCDAFGIASPAKETKPLGKYIVEGIWNGFTEFDILKKIKEWGKGVLEGISSLFTGKNSKSESVDIDVKLKKSGWSTIASWIGKIPGVSQAVSLAKSGWSTIKKWVGSIPTVSQAVGLMKSGWSSVKSWIGTMPTLSAGIKLMKSGWSSIKSWLGSLDFKLNFKLPKIGIEWGTKTFAGFKISYPKNFYTYARGGFPDMGELFIAREAGPEMVGKIGNKNAVVNNQQIVESVSEGVYAAVLAAMRQSESNGAQSVNVYLDGRQITSSVEKHQRERGATIMRNGVYAY